MGRSPVVVGRTAWRCVVDRLLDQREAARILGVSVRTLERHRISGTGPQFCRIGRLVRYRERDLDDWVSRSPVDRCTMEKQDKDAVTNTESEPDDDDDLFGPIPSFEEAVEKRKKRISELLESDDKGQRRLADRLKECRRGNDQHRHPAAGS
jgi:predicted DNA-binding transcriptional regulator AlpA